jgi:hypothetical protein
VKDSARRLIRDKRIAHFVAALDEEATKWKWDVPSQYSSDPESLLLMAVAYAFSLYVRAWAYGWTLGDQSADPFYRCVWIRNSALNSDEAFGAVRERTLRPEWFPWGEILTRIFGDTCDDSARVRSALTGIRDQSDAFFNGYCELLAVTDPESTRLDREIMIATVLQNAGATPKLKRRAHVQQLLSLLRGLLSSKPAAAAAGVAAPLLVGAEKIVAYTPPDMIDRIEGKLALRFRRDKFWDEFDRRSLDPVRDWEEFVLGTGDATAPRASQP